MITEQNVSFFAEKSRQLLAEISKDMIGQQDVVENAVIAMIAGGNALLEGVPGVGKTRLVRSMGQAFSLPFSRIQFTPDLMPADVTGTNIIEKDATGANILKFQKGPIFSNIILADEINRATPKTQSALLEAMQEHTVTVGGQTYQLEEPFFVLATQNPIEQDGTYPLPEAQMDRFMFKLEVGFPSIDELTAIVNMTQETMEEQAQAVLTGADLLEMRATAKEIPIIDEVLQFAMKLVSATHPELAEASDFAKKYIRFGASPRAAQALITAGKVRALMNGRYNVSYDDIKALAYPVLRHRVKPSFTAITEKISVDTIIEKLLEEVSGKRNQTLAQALTSGKKKR